MKVPPLTSQLIRDSLADNFLEFACIGCHHRAEISGVIPKGCGSLFDCCWKAAMNREGSCMHVCAYLGDHFLSITRSIHQVCHGADNMTDDGTIRSDDRAKTVKDKAVSCMK